MPRVKIAEWPPIYPTKPIRAPILLVDSVERPLARGRDLGAIFLQENQKMDPERHADSRNFVESILRYVPGFRGYLEKEYRRESDYLARTWLADQLQSTKRPLDEFFRGLLDAGQIDAMPLLDRIRTRLDGLIAKMRGDVRGYSGIFDYVRIGQRELDRVYNEDMALIKEVTQFVKTVDHLTSQSTPAGKMAGELLQQLDTIETAYGQRTDILKGLADETL